MALAGPAVNLILAGALFLLVFMTDSVAPLAQLGVAFVPSPERLMMVNIFFLVFNLIPAFPMDGGRVLRALLAMRGNSVQATQRAAHVGQGIALLFGLSGVLAGNPMLVFISLFVWIGAAPEATLTRINSVMSGIPVSQAIVTELKSLAPIDTLGRAVALTIAGLQTIFR